MLGLQKLLNRFAGRHVTQILQTEASECGLACVAMVANFHGCHFDLTALRKRFPTSLKGANLSSLIAIADNLGLDARALRLELEQLASLKCPAILHWNMNHFVILEMVRGNRIWISDPAIGRRVLSLQDASPHFTGVVLEITPTTRFVTRADAETYSVWDCVGRNSAIWKPLAQILAFSLLLELLTISAAIFIQVVIDKVIDARQYSLLTTLSFAFILLALVTAVVQASRSWIVAGLRSHLNYQRSKELLNHLIHLPMEYFEKRFVGDIASRFGSLRTIQETVSSNFIEVIVDGLMAAGTFAIMIVYSVPLALLVLAAVAAYVVVRLAIFRPVYRATQERIASGAKTESRLFEIIKGIQTIKVLNNEPERHALWVNHLVANINADLKVSKLNIVGNSLRVLEFGVASVLVIWVGAREVISGQMSIGMIFAFVALENQFIQKVADFIAGFVRYKMLAVEAQRVSDIANTEREDLGGTVVLEARSNIAISLRRATFRYGMEESPIFENFDLCVTDGEAVAIIGPSGCGKTTLLKIMLGLLQLESGAVFINEQNLRDVGLGAYRRLACAVMQDDQLFSGTIADNIACFAQEIDREHMRWCAEQAAIHEQIMAMPMGYQTLVGEIGLAASGGEKQRLLLARALYRKPSVLFLDEATSHLDATTERVVSESVSRLSCTRIIVSHSSTVTASVDRVIDLGELRSTAAAAGAFLVANSARAG